MSGTTTLTRYEPCGVCAERLRTLEAEAGNRLAETIKIADEVQRTVDRLERELYNIPAYVSDAKVARYAELKRAIISKQNRQRKLDIDNSPYLKTGTGKKSEKLGRVRI